MKLRQLELKDAPTMLEWMHDESVVKNLSANFAQKKLQDCEAFIKASENDKENLNLAIVDENDEYMGTVSLKHIDQQNGTAEFAITVHSKAMGKGYSKYGMKTILEMGLKEIGLKNIYWCVSTENARAIRFYDKNGYKRVTQVPKKISEPYVNHKNLIWYVYN